MTPGRHVIAVVVVALTLLERASAHAQPGRVALVGTPANVERAVATTLQSWGVEVVSVPHDASLLDASSATHARALARTHGAAAVVWLSRPPAAHSLWVYDVAQDRILSRRLAGGPPLRDATAASLALTIKTMLRNSMDPAVRPAPSQPPLASQPPPALQPRLATQPPPLPPSLPAAQLREPAAPATRAPLLRLEALLGVRPELGQGPRAEPRFLMGAEWSPAFLPSRLALALLLVVGPGAAVDRGGFDGDLGDIAAGVELRRRLASWSRLRVAGALGGSVHLTHLAGRISATGEHASVRRTLMAVDAGVTMRVQLSPMLHGALRLASAYLPYRQRYRAYDQPVVDLPRLSIELGAGLSVVLPW